MTQILPPLVLPTHAPGTPSNPNQGPQGPAGAPGAPGTAGPEGPQGPAGSGGDGYGSNIFVYRPFDPDPGPNTFLTFQEAYNKAIATKVPFTIAFDDHIDSCYIYAGAYDLSHATFQGGLAGNEQVVVFVEDHAIFTGIYKLTDNIALLYDGTSNPLITVDGNVDTQKIMYMENSAFFTTINTSPFYNMFNGASVVINLGEDCGIQPSSSNPVIVLDECEIQISFVGGGSYISNDAIKVAIPGNTSFVELFIETPSPGSVPSTFLDPDIETGYDTEVQTLYTQPLKGNTSERPTAPFVQEGMMFYDFQIGLPVWWDGSQWKDSTKPYLPEFLHITIDSPQTTGLVTGGHINFNTPLVSVGNTFGGYSSPGVFFVSFFDSTQGPNYPNVAHKLVANLSDFDGSIIYQWWDTTNNVGLGNVATNAGNGKSSDAIAFIPNDYMHNQSVAVFIELRLLFVAGTTSIGENTAGGFVLPWATMESIGTPILT